MMKGFKQLKTKYNLQIAKNNQSVLDYKISPNPTLIPFLRLTAVLNDLHMPVSDTATAVKKLYRHHR